ncbi:MAG: Na(+)-translocating NADH-quinone reductase subunit A [Gemmatimonas sp.]
MAVHKVTKGLDLPISGSPEQIIFKAPPVSRVAVLLRDFNDLKTRLLVEPGAPVRVGQPLMTHREHPTIRLVSPGGGRVEAVHRGDKRALHSVVIALDDHEGPAIAFTSFTPEAGRSRDAARALLLESGLWTAIRTRPFSHMPDPDATPSSIFVTALDTHPLAPDIDIALKGREDDVARGLLVLKQLTDGPVYVCRRPGSSLGGATSAASGIRVEEFTGKHPAGTAGYHIHVLDPVNRGKQVWHVGAQDVARIGHLFATGQLDTSLVIALGGPQVTTPRLLRTRLGASTLELTSGQVREGDSRIVSGSVLSGERADDAVHGFIGRFHQQVCVLEEGGAREFLGWMAPGAHAFSLFPAFLSSLMPRRQFALDTSMHGSRRAMVPIGAYERVMPMDLMPTHLLRALTVGDLEWAEELGVLELDEEDVALCAFVCPGKYEHGAALRRALTALAAEH